MANNTGIERVILIALLLLLAQNCSNSKNEAFKQFIKKYPQYSLDEFVYVQQYKPGYNIQFDLYNSDSSKTLSFAFFPDCTNYLKSIYFLSFQERDVYKDSCIVRGFDSNRNLLYSFYHKSNSFVPGSDAIFIKGEYYYLYEYERYSLSKEGIKFYIQHKDSIINNGLNLIRKFKE